MPTIYHFIYKITNSINGKYYVGVHSTKEIEDGYMGSGSLLKRAINKYGVANFEREILHHFEHRQDALTKEAEIVNADFLSLENTYNLVFGGGGIRTIKEKAIFFNKDKVREVVYKEPPFEKYDPENYFKLSLIKPIEWPAPIEPEAQTTVRNYLRSIVAPFITDNVNGFCKHMADLINNKYTHKKGLKAFFNMYQYHGIYNNVLIEKVKWPDPERMTA